MSLTRSLAAAATLQTIQRVFEVPVTVTRGPVEIRRGREGLRPLLHQMQARRGAEVGVWKGGHAELLCQALPDMHLLAVDAWATYDGYLEQKNDAAKMAEAYAEAQQRLAPHRCTFVVKPSVEAAATVARGSLDFVYIDANHLAQYVTADLEAWMPTLRSGGILAGHDYVVNPRKSFLQAKRAVDAFVSARNLQPLFVLAGDKTPSFFLVAP